MDRYGEARITSGTPAAIFGQQSSSRRAVNNPNASRPTTSMAPAIAPRMTSSSQGAMSRGGLATVSGGVSRGADAAPGGTFTVEGPGAYESTLESYRRAGLATVLAAQRDLARARTTEIQSRADLLTTSAALTFAAGD
jgi:hypothetical protein